MKVHIPYTLLAICLCCLASCAPKKSLIKENNISQNYSIDTTIVKDKSVNLLITEYKIGLDSTMGKIVAHTNYPLTKAQPDCTLGYWVTDALLQVARTKDPLTHAAISNYGGIRISYVPSGPITLGQVYEIAPFENTLYIVEVPAKVLEEWCNHIAKKGGWPVSDISFTIENEKATHIKIKGQTLNHNLVYRIATNDYLANGGDDCTFLKELKKYKYSNLLRDAMIEYAQSKDTLNFQLENRIQYAE